jgi:hypothetical protein
MKQLQIAILALSTVASLSRGQTPTCTGGTVAPEFGFTFLYCPHCLSSRYEHGVQRTVYTGPFELHGIKADGPGAGLLKEEDVVEAIDGLPIATLAGLEHFDTFRPGAIVVLNIRRGGAMIDVPIRPTPYCRRGFAKTATAPKTSRMAPTAPPSRITGTAWFGFGLSCGACVARAAAGGVAHWAFPVNPVVEALDAGGPAALAGLRVGDTLIAIDRHSLQSDAGGLRLRSALPGDRIEITYLRGGIERSSILRPIERGPGQP